MIDLGSGAFIEGATFASWGLPAEPSVSSVVASGVHLCTFSGDKLLGGPQAGILVGDAETIGLVRSHPLMRALRPDKMTLAALCATLELYRDGRAHEVPTCAMLSASADDLRARADELAESIGPLGRLSIEVVPCDSAVGGGAMPLGKLSSMAVAVGGAAAHVIDDRLRACQPSVVGRIHDERFLLDVRTLFDRAQREAVARALQSIDEESPE